MSNPLHNLVLNYISSYIWNKKINKINNEYHTLYQVYNRDALIYKSILFNYRILRNIKFYSNIYGCGNTRFKLNKNYK